MRKVFLYLLLPMLAVVFTACPNDDNDDGFVKTKIKLQYEKDGIAYPNVDIRFSLFEVMEGSDEWVYNEALHYFTLPNGSPYIPSYIFRTNKVGEIREQIKDNTSYIFVYELVVNSEYYRTNRGVIDTKNRESYEFVMIDVLPTKIEPSEI